MPCPRHVARYITDNNGTRGNWIYGYPCGQPSVDPDTGYCQDHVAPSGFTPLTQLLQHIRANENPLPEKTGVPEDPTEDQS